MLVGEQREALNSEFVGVIVYVQNLGGHMLFLHIQVLAIIHEMLDHPLREHEGPKLYSSEV